ncbi:hypothetical protein PoB_005932200 [Plakobranchus ocellatus]|uniref:Sulfatase N-terminal domain-containing protein n=1 Tax=Plakobranchus ocellatus TaxID=259542 RepID=A0AAV4CLP5_9GAST|nr:hypothetical protein PoB_005932200 [Plakobranchus ocellatus]
MKSCGFEQVALKLSAVEQWSSMEKGLCPARVPGHGSVGGTVARESALRSAGTPLSRVRTPSPAPWPDGGPESLNHLAVDWLYTQTKPSRSCYDALRESDPTGQNGKTKIQILQLKRIKMSALVKVILSVNKNLKPRCFRIFLVLATSMVSVLYLLFIREDPSILKNINSRDWQPPKECTFPSSDPFDPSLEGVIKKHPPVDCSNETLNIVYMDKYVLKLNSTKLKQMKMMGAKFSHCRYKEIARKKGSDKAFEYTWFRWRYNRAEFVDQINEAFIWTDARKIGYRTGMMLDAYDLTAFHYQKKGFKVSPVDYYQRATVIASSRDRLMRSRDNHCIGDIPEVTQVQDYWLQMVSTFGKNRSTPFFAYSFATRFTHDDSDYAYKGDVVYYKFLQDLVATDSLDNTVIVWFSDHGPRFGPIRSVWTTMLLFS